MKKIGLVILISLMMLPGANAAVVAKVGTLKITDKDVDSRLKQLPPQYKASYASEAGRRYLSKSLYLISPVKVCLQYNPHALSGTTNHESSEF